MTRRYSTGRLAAWIEIRNGWRRGQRYQIAQRMGPSSVGTEPHWACPSCGLPCSCAGAARFLAHRDCEWWEL